MNFKRLILVSVIAYIISCIYMTIIQNLYGVADLYSFGLGISVAIIVDIIFDIGKVKK